MSVPETVLFAGGGTGGHLFPALAVAEQVLELRPTTRVLFLCSDRPLDASILKAEQLRGEPVDFEVIPARPFSVRPVGALRFVRSWGGAVRAGRRAIREAKQRGPVWVVAGGGFVAAPVVQAARVERVPVLMLNLDAAPGLANRWISKRAKVIVTTAPAPGVTWERIPPIVRRAAIAPGDAAECRRRLGLDPERPTLFVTGASQGAESINRMMALLVREHAAALAGWQVVHQTGRQENSELEEAYRAAGVPAVVFGFRNDMGVAWGCADMAVSRAGAGSVAEAWANHVPTVFMPYPYHRDQHQKKNAEPLVEAGGAVVCTDRVDAAANVDSAGAEVLSLLGDAPRRLEMKKALDKLGPADGAKRVALKLICP